MKLESWAFIEAMDKRDMHTAASILLQHFDLEERLPAVLAARPPYISHAHPVHQMVIFLSSGGFLTCRDSNFSDSNWVECDDSARARFKTERIRSVRYLYRRNYEG